MGTQVTLVYTIVALGAPSSKLQSFVVATPIPPVILQAFGLRVLSDSTTVPAVNPIVRTIVLGFEPSSVAQVLGTISNTANIESLIVDPVHAGLDYILPPIITANDNKREPLTKIVKGNKIGQRATQVDAIFKAYMAAYQVAVDNGGTGYVAASTKVAFLGGLPPANFNFDARKGFQGGCVRYINIADPGEGYDPTTAKLNIQGGSNMGNTPPIPAVGNITFDAAGRVQSIVIVDMGSGYDSVPNVFITTTTGKAPKRPARLFAVMAEGRPARATVTVNAGPPNDITGITITDPGDNYVEVPQILITDSGGGTGALATARMGLGRIEIVDRGEGYYPGTTFTVTPAFEAMFPPVSGEPQAQAAMFFQLLQAAIGQNAITPLVSTAPLVA